MERVPNFIAGQRIFSQSDRRVAITDPALGESYAQVALSNAQEVSAAISAAEQAFPAWAATPPLRRARILFQFRHLLEQHRDELAKLISREHGKVYSDALGEITRGLEVVEFACGIPHLQKGEFSANVGGGVDSHSLMQPLGVVAGITPFNFPAMVPMWMFPVALACGNTFILKPSEKVPSTAVRLAELLMEAGLPAGVFNVVHGDKEAVNVLLHDPRIKAVSFVGSTPIARTIYATACEQGKRVQALGGAKNHAVIMPDADLDLAVNSLLGAAYGSAGERCMALSVAVAVGDDIADKLVAALVPKIRALRIGPGLSEGPENEMGPLISREHQQRVSHYIDTGVQQGATLCVDGRGYQVAGYEQGFFLGGTLFDHVTPQMTIYREEIFGPVLAIVRVPDYASAVRLINQHQYGNGSALFTRDGDCARQFSEEVQTGMVGINIPIPVPMAFHCFGGWKESLFGPLHMHGPDGVRFYTKMKTVTSRWTEGVRSQSGFSMPTM